MFYVMSLERDDWGKLSWFRRGRMYKSMESAHKVAVKYRDSLIYKYGNKVPVHIRSNGNDQRFD